jgi:hypothetical protein
MYWKKTFKYGVDVSLKDKLNWQIILFKSKETDNLVSVLEKTFKYGVDLYP